MNSSKKIENLIHKKIKIRRERKKNLQHEKKNFPNLNEGRMK